MKDRFEFIPPGVSDDFVRRQETPFRFITEADASSLLLPRQENAHKGTYGHALLICGSRGMSGAAILATGAALRSGCGLVTCHLPHGEHISLAANTPSALISLDPSDRVFTRLPEDMAKYNAVGVGCGLGQSPETVKALELLVNKCVELSTPLVLDADALNILAANETMQKILPADSILTPHRGELRRLIGEWSSEEEMITAVRQFAARTRTIIVVKGPNTMVCARGETLSFNSTGNAGMAKGGSGDVLTGYITGLLARGYSPENAAVLGVYIHGSAGDKASTYFGPEGMNSSDLIDFLAEATLELG